MVGCSEKDALTHIGNHSVGAWVRETVTAPLCSTTCLPLAMYQTLKKGAKLRQEFPVRNCATEIVIPATGYGCVRTTGTVRHKAEVQRQGQREQLFSDMSWAHFAGKKNRPPPPAVEIEMAKTHAAQSMRNTGCNFGPWCIVV